MFPELVLFINILHEFNDLNDIFKEMELNLNEFDEIKDEDLFQILYQDVISTNMRYKLGEYYTSSWLSDLLIEESKFKPGERALDPTCGSGTFIVGLIKKILGSDLNIDRKVQALKKIHGYDINPLAIACTKLNFLIILSSNLPNFKINLREIFQNFKFLDCLGGNSDALKCDLIIGNPPWLTYKELSLNEQKKILKIATYTQIKPDSKNIANLEISTVFFYRVVNLYLKNSGRIMFLTTHALINGAHASKFRKFKGFNDVVLYKINDNVFNTETIAWLARKADEVFFNTNNKILTKIIENQRVMKKIHLYPLFNSDLEVGKLILEEDKLKINDIKSSPYSEICNRGFSAFPRIFFFVEHLKINGDFIYRVNIDIITRTKGFWKENASKISDSLNKFYQSNSRGLKDYEFSIIISRNFESFHINELKSVILPIYFNASTQNYDFINEDNQETEIARHYKLINGLWQESSSSKKERVNTIFKRLNYQNDLLKREMYNPIKVIYNEAGSKLKSVVLENSSKILIDITLYYVATSNIYEAHYLCAIFNSDIFNEKLKILKSDRHFHKRPVTELPIPKFNESNLTHIKLSELSKKCHFNRKKGSSNDQNVKRINNLVSTIFN